MKASPHRPTKALIHLGAIRQNIQQMGAHIPEGTLKWAVVKANAYGHGAVVVAKAIQEVGLFKFKTVLSAKALQNDKKVVLVDRFYPSSKTCSKCGHIYNDLKLQDRHWCCPKCDTNHDRDKNAALNILYEGRRISAV